MPPLSYAKFPLRLLLALLIGSTVAIMIMVWQAWLGIAHMEIANIRQENLIALRGETLYHTEKMMADARLYTRTMRPQWLSRYNASKTGLEQNLADIYRLIPEAFSEFGDEIESNKDRLNELEQASFALMEQNYRQEGLDLLSSSEYLNFSDDLTKNLTELSQRLTQINRTEAAAARDTIQWHGLLVIEQFLSHCWQSGYSAYACWFSGERRCLPK